jgi:hypothetical protein
MSGTQFQVYQFSNSDKYLTTCHLFLNHHLPEWHFHQPGQLSNVSWSYESVDHFPRLDRNKNGRSTFVKLSQAPASAGEVKL